MTDGPYPETKEVVGGYFIAECEDLDQAIDVASRIPDRREPGPWRSAR